MKHYQLIVIGGGTAAIAAISEALARDAKPIAYIERRQQIGGECALYGCVPIHSMFVAANCLQQLKKARAYGVETQNMHLNFPQLATQVEQIVTEDLSDPFADTLQVTRYTGEAAFADEHTIHITKDGSSHTISGEHILIATGAHPIIPNITGIQECGYWLYPQASRATRLPESITIIGGGRIGTEFAQLFQQLGSQVTLLECQASLLPREDNDLSQAAYELLKQENIDIFLSAEVIQATRISADSEKSNPIKRVTFMTQTQKLLTVDSEEILLATGREGNISELCLHNTSIAIDRNQILVDENCRTSVPHIWAVGDVVGPYRFTHAADYQAVVAIQNMLRYRSRAVSYRSLPVVYFLNPPLARVGLTENQARENYEHVVILKEEVEAITRFRIEGETRGFCKILVDAETDEILGAHIVAPHAEDLIHLPALAMQQHIPIGQLTQLVYSYPTRSQLIQKTLEPYILQKTDRAASLANHPSKDGQ
jgi:pyruvate/2-oxoglutarate dehydrogenase complex dihydrolipoamide dehydrogenase (E3) component